MPTVILSHQVRDYDAWKAGFDGDQARRAAAGLKSHTVGRVPGNPDTAVIVFEVDDVAKLQGLMQDPELQAKMAEGGVLSAPTVQVLEGAESKTY